MSCKQLNGVVREALDALDQVLAKRDPSGFIVGITKDAAGRAAAYRAAGFDALEVLAGGMDGATALEVERRMFYAVKDAERGSPRLAKAHGKIIDGDHRASLGGAGNGRETYAVYVAYWLDGAGTQPAASKAGEP